MIIWRHVWLTCVGRSLDVCVCLMTACVCVCVYICMHVRVNGRNNHKALINFCASTKWHSMWHMLLYNERVLSRSVKLIWFLCIYSYVYTNMLYIYTKVIFQWRHEHSFHFIFYKRTTFNNFDYQLTTIYVNKYFHKYLYRHKLGHNLRNCLKLLTKIANLT